MENNNVKKSLFVRVFEVIMRFVLKFRIPVLFLIAAGTVFFIKALFSLQIDANIFGTYLVENRCIMHCRMTM